MEILAYAAASALFLGDLVAGREAPARIGRWVLGAGVATQLADIAVRCFARQNPLSSTPEAVAFVGFLVASGYLLASFRYRLSAAGAFAVPAALILLVLARVGAGWRGRRAAWLTLGGFGGTIMVLLVYFLRHAV